MLQSILILTANVGFLAIPGLVLSNLAGACKLSSCASAAHAQHDKDVALFVRVHTCNSVLSLPQFCVAYPMTLLTASTPAGTRQAGRAFCVAWRR